MIREERGETLCIINTIVPEAHDFFANKINRIRLGKELLTPFEFSTMFYFSTNVKLSTKHSTGILTLVHGNN